VFGETTKQRHTASCDCLTLATVKAADCDDTCKGPTSCDRARRVSLFSEPMAPGRYYMSVACQVSLVPAGSRLTALHSDLRAQFTPRVMLWLWRTTRHRRHLGRPRTGICHSPRLRHNALTIPPSDTPVINQLRRAVPIRSRQARHGFAVSFLRAIGSFPAASASPLLSTERRQPTSLRRLVDRIAGGESAVHQRLLRLAIVTFLQLLKHRAATRRCRCRGCSRPRLR